MKIKAKARPTRSDPEFGDFVAYPSWSDLVVTTDDGVPLTEIKSLMLSMHRGQSPKDCVTAWIEVYVSEIEVDLDDGNATVTRSFATCRRSGRKRATIAWCKS